MADESSQYQLVTFQLGDELYGVDIMDVKEIVKVQAVRPIPNAPYYVEGIINLRGEIIPIINLHKRFHIQKRKATDNLDDYEEDDVINVVRYNSVRNFLKMRIDEAAGGEGKESDDLCEVQEADRNCT